MEDPKGHAGWLTHNEIDYINDLASGEYKRTFSEHNWKTEPLDMLKKYVKNAKRRKAFGIFGQVDAEKVIAHAENLIAKLEGR